jgi:hypothetical protein
MGKALMTLLVHQGTAVDCGANEKARHQGAPTHGCEVTNKAARN